MAKKKETGTALVNWDEELAKYAKESTAGIKESGNGKFLSFRGGNMTFNGEDIPDSELECVIVGWTHHNTYYDPDERYDPKNPQTPICYSFGTDEDLMEPHNDSPDKQCGSCAECPFNQFESAKNGPGKACKNTFRVALIAASELNDVENAEVVYASIPPKSLKNFANYLKKEIGGKLNRPFWSVITTMTCEPDSQSQFKVLFKCSEVIKDNKLFQPLKDKWEETMEGIEFPYPVKVAEKKSSKKEVAKKPAAKNKFSRK